MNNCLCNCRTYRLEFKSSFLNSYQQNSQLLQFGFPVRLISITIVLVLYLVVPVAYSKASGQENPAQYSEFDCIPLSSENVPDTAQQQSTETSTPIIQIASKKSQIHEGESASFIIASESGPVESDLNVYFTVTASSGFYSGSTNIGFKLRKGTEICYFRVETIDDESKEINGSIVVTILDNANYSAFVNPESGETIDRIEVLILDNEIPVYLPEFSISSNLAEVEEGEPAVFVIASNIPIPDFDRQINISVDRMGDYFILDSPTQFTIAEGEVLSFLNIETVDDDTYKIGGTVSVSIKAGNRYTVKSAPNNKATVAIVDNDEIVPLIFVDSSTNRVTEGETFEFVVGIDNSNHPGNHRSESDLAIKLMISVQGSYYNGIPPGQVEIPAGESYSSIRIETWDNEIDELDGQIVATVIPGTDYYPVLPTSSPGNSAKVSVLDNEKPILGISVPNYSNICDIPVEGYKLTYLISSNIFPKPGLTVHLRKVQTGEFASGILEDFTINASSQTVTRTTEGSYTWEVYVRTKNNLRAEPNDQIHLRILDDPDYTVDESSRFASQSVRNDDPFLDCPDVGITADSYSVVEGGTVGITVGVNGIPEGGIMIKLDVSQDGNHIHWGAIRQIFFDEGQEFRFEITTIDDDLVQSDTRSFTVSILEDTGNYTITPHVSKATIEIVDDDENKTADSTPVYSVVDTVIHRILQSIPDNDDSAQAAESKNQQLSEPELNQSDFEVTVVSATQSIFEGAPAIFQILSSQTLPETITVNLKVSVIGNFIETPLPEMVKIPAGQSSAEIEVPTVDDELAEEDGSIIVTIQSGMNYEIANPQHNSAVVRVSDVHDRNSQMEYVKLANRLVIPSLLDSVVSSSTQETYHRLDQILDTKQDEWISNGNSINFPKFVVNSGNLANENISDWLELFKDTGFEGPILVDAGFAKSINFWGNGARNYIDFDLDADGFYGVGTYANAVAGAEIWHAENIAYGFSTSVADVLTDISTDKLTDLNYRIKSIGLHPYWGWKSMGELSEFHIVSTFGLGETLVSQTGSEPMKMDSKLLALSVAGKKSLLDSIYGTGSNIPEFSVKGKSEFTHTISTELSNLDRTERFYSYGLDYGMEGKYNYEFPEDVSINSFASLGVSKKGGSLESSTCAKYSGGMNFDDSLDPYSVEMRHSMDMCGNQSTALSFSSKITYGQNNGKGLRFSINPTWSHFELTEYWLSDSFAWKSSYESADSAAFNSRLSAEVEYGIETMNGLSFLTPYAELDLHGQERRIGIGSRLSKDSQFDLNANVSQLSSNGDSASYHVRFDGRFNW